MFTTGSKLFLGLSTAAFAAIVLFAAATNGNIVGVMSIASAVVALAMLGGVVLFVRDGDPAADAAGPVPPPATSPTSIWPVVGGFGIAVLGLGLVLDKRLFLFGLVAVVASIVEWMVQSYADRASADPGYNRAVRGRLLQPIEFPVLAALVGVGIILGFSRIMVALPEKGSLVAFIAIGVLVIGGATLLASRPEASKTLLTVLCVLGALGLLVGGILGASKGERNFAAALEENANRSGNAVAAKSNPIAIVIRANGALNTDQLVLPKGLTGHVLFRNNDDGKFNLVIQSVVRVKGEGGTITEVVTDSKTDFIGKGKVADIVVRESVVPNVVLKFMSEPVEGGSGAALEGTILVP